jgi:phytoene dehydrogenase-like protein
VTLRLGERAAFAPAGGGQLRVGPEGDQALYDAVVVNADPLVVEERRDAPLALSGVVLHLSCEAGAALPHHLILFSRDARREFEALGQGKAPEDPAVYVCRPAATDPSMASGGREPLFVMVNAPARWDGVPDEVPEALEARAWAKVAALPGVLGLKRHGARGPRELALLGAPGGSIYGFVPRGRLGPLRRPRLRSRQPGVFFAGGGTHPGGGVPLVMRSGEFAAALALEHVRQKSGRAVA